MPPQITDPREEERGLIPINFHTQPYRPHVSIRTCAGPDQPDRGSTGPPSRPRSDDKAATVRTAPAGRRSLGPIAPPIATCFEYVEPRWSSFWNCTIPADEVLLCSKRMGSLPLFCAIRIFAVRSGRALLCWGPGTPLKGADRCIRGRYGNF